jgi:hypothetical protein
MKIPRRPKNEVHICSKAECDRIFQAAQGLSEYDIMKQAGHADSALAVCPLRGYGMPFDLVWIAHGTIKRGIMTENLDLLNAAVSLLIRAAPRSHEPSLSESARGEFGRHKAVRRSLDRRRWFPGRTDALSFWIG